MKIVEGKLVDVWKREIYSCSITVSEGKILSIERNSEEYNYYIIPGFVDAHVHVESSMLLPDAFAKAVVQRGTVAVVNDPHEVANVLGMEGIEMMMERASLSPLKFHYGIPSCVPATPLDHSGSRISVEDVAALAQTGRFVTLSEVMDVSGVLEGQPEVMEKIRIAREHGLRIDGHAPGLRGDELSRYVAAGIETDHEITSLEEAQEKLKRGMRVLIREGSAAKNYKALKSLIASHPDQIMFCTDDAHPDDILEQGHIDKIVSQAIDDGYDIFSVLRAASVNPVEFYGMQVGLLRPGDPADYVVVDDLRSWNILATSINGNMIYQAALKPSLAERTPCLLNRFVHDPITPDMLYTPAPETIQAIRIIPNELITGSIDYSPEKPGASFESDTSRDDILKIVYLNRYANGAPQIAFIHGFSLKRGAIASSISHDSHNIIAVGCDDHSLSEAINAVIAQQGGLAVVEGGETHILPLPVAGIMSNWAAEEVASVYKDLNIRIKRMGSTLKSPFMTLSFMTLTVIPEWKIGEKGLFDVHKGKFLAQQE